MSSKRKAEATMQYTGRGRGTAPALPATALLQRREVCRSEDFVVLAHDHGLSSGAKRLELGILPLGFAGPLAVIQIFIRPDVDDLIQGADLCGPPAHQLGVFADGRQRL